MNEGNRRSRGLAAACLGISLCSVGLGLIAQGETNGIPRENREIILVVELSHHSSEQSRWLYRRIEDFAVKEGYQLLKDAYSSVHLLGGSRATLENLARSLAARAADPRVRAIDVVVQVHGLPDHLAFHDGDFSADRIAQRLKEERSAAPKLRALYSGACYGDSHGDSWLDAGFQVVNGAIKVNTNGLYDFPAFLKAWRAGRTFGEAQEQGNNPYWVNFFDRLSERLGYPGPANSYKNVLGRRNLAIDMEPARLWWHWQDKIPDGDILSPRPGPVEPVGAGVAPPKPGEDTASRTAPWERVPSDRTGLIRLNDSLVRAFFPK